MCSKSSENNEQSESVPILIQISDVQADPSIAKFVVDREADVVALGDINFANTYRS